MSHNGQLIIHAATNYDVLFLPVNNGARNGDTPISRNSNNNIHHTRENEDDVNSITSQIDLVDDDLFNRDHMSNLTQVFDGSPASFDPFLVQESLTPISPAGGGGGGGKVGGGGGGEMMDVVEFHDPTHVGNNRFMVQISMHRDRFQDAYKQRNTQVCDEIIYRIIRVVSEKCHPKGRFLEMVPDWNHGTTNEWKDLGTGIGVKDRVEKILLNPPDTPITAALEGRGEQSSIKGGGSISTSHHGNQNRTENNIQPSDVRTPPRNDPGDLDQNNAMSPLFGIDDTQSAHQPDEFPRQHLPIPSLPNDSNHQNQFGFQMQQPHMATFDPNAFQPRAEVESSHDGSTIISTNPSSIDNFSASTMRSSNFGRRGRNRQRLNRRGPQNGIQRQGKISSAIDTSQIPMGMMNLDSVSDLPTSEMTASCYSHDSSEHDSFGRVIPNLSSHTRSASSGQVVRPEPPLSSSSPQELDLHLDKIRVLTLQQTIDRVKTYDVLCENNPITISLISSRGYVGNNRIRIMMQMNEYAYSRGNLDQRSAICHEICSNVINGIKGQGRFLMKNGETECIEVDYQNSLDIVQKCMNELLIELTASFKKPATSQQRSVEGFGKKACQALQSRNEKQKQKIMGAYQREEIQRKMIDMAQQETKMLRNRK